MVEFAGRRKKQEMGLNKSVNALKEIPVSVGSGTDNESYAVELKNVTKDYERYAQTVRALCGVDLKIEKKQQVVVTGASGSGKSTLLHLIGTLDRPTAGEIRIEGRDVAKMTENVVSNFRNSRVGFVFQMNNLLGEFTALENVMLPGLIAGLKAQKVKERARYLLSLVGLEHRLAHRPRELSGGEGQRTAIARALLMSPTLLLADEPTGNLDQKSSNMVFELMQKSCEAAQTTMVLVTHDQSLAQSFDRQVVMADGAIQEKVNVL